MKIKKVMMMSEIWKITPENGRIGISAMSGWGKTYLSLALLKKGIQAGYKVYVLSYTKHSEKNYWEELKKYGNVDIHYAEFKGANDIIKFFYEVFKDKKGGKILYINDFDLYLNRADSTTIALLNSIFSSIRKSNSIFIYETKSIKGSRFLFLLDNTDILFLGRFGRLQETLVKHLGIEDLEISYNKLQPHEFLIIDTTTQKVKFVKVVGDDIVEIPKDLDVEDKTKEGGEDEYY